MTAYRIVDKYSELCDVPSGSYTPAQINDFIASGSAGSFPLSATYLLLTPTSSLPNARVLVTGSGIILTDNSTSGTLTVSVDPDYIRSFIQWNETPTGTIDGVNTSFVLAHTPYPSGSLQLYYNGQLLDQGPNCDFTLSGSTITMLFSPIFPDKLRATYPK